MWTQSDFVIQLRSKNRHRRYGSRVWLTRSELAAKYSSIEIADQIIAAKMAIEDDAVRQSQVRTHPDMNGIDTPDPCMQWRVSRIKKSTHIQSIDQYLLM